MKLLYQNNYGTSYFLKNAPITKCKIQLIIPSIVIVITAKKDLIEGTLFMLNPSKYIRTIPFKN